MITLTPLVGKLELGLGVAPPQHSGRSCKWEATAFAEGSNNWFVDCVLDRELQYTTMESTHGQVFLSMASTRIHETNSHNKPLALDFVR